MKTSYHLRKIGPRTFISYSFHDREIADRLYSYLSQIGFQVRMEDETSLLGQDLKEALPHRIGGSEVFIQLLTKTSNHSAWVKREFDWALAHQSAQPPLLILPVVFSRDTLYDPVNDRVYIDATSSGLTQKVLDLIERASLNTVELLPLSAANIFQFEQEKVEAILDHGATIGKRIIADSDGILLTLMHEILDFADSANHPSFLEQEKDHARQVESLLPAVDQVIPRFVQELQFAFKDWGRDFPWCAVGSVDHLSKLVIGRQILRCSQVLLIEKSSLLPALICQIDDARGTIERAQQQNPDDADLARMCWALSACSTGEAGKLEWIGLEAERGKQSMTLAFPVRRIGPDWLTLLQAGGSPLSLITPRDWADFCIPQIAAHTVWSAAARNIPVKEVQDSYAWRLSEYTRVGLA